MYAGFIVRVCRDFDKNDVREKKNFGTIFDGDKDKWNVFMLVFRFMY